MGEGTLGVCTRWDPGGFKVFQKVGFQWILMRILRGFVRGFLGGFVCGFGGGFSADSGIVLFHYLSSRDSRGIVGGFWMN